MANDRKPRAAEDDQDRNPSGVRIHTRHVVTLCLALLALVVSLGLDHPAEAGKSLFETLFTAEMGAALFRELAFALLIALAISLGIERQAREEDARLADSQRRAIAENVFRGVFANHLPREYVDLVVEKTLRVSVIRDYLQSYDRISPLSEDYAEMLGAQAKDYCIHHRLVSSRIRNVSVGEIDEEMSFSFANRTAPLSGLTKLCRLEIGDDRYDERTAAKLLQPGSDDELVYKWKLRLKPGESKEFLVETMMIKDRSDSEILGVLWPAMKYELTAQFEIPVEEFGIADRTATPAREVYNDTRNGVAKWVADGPILPNNSVTLWWRAKRQGQADEAATAKSPPVPSASPRPRPDAGGRAGAPRKARIPAKRN